MSKSNIVYSTNPDLKEFCPTCDLPLEDCICPVKETVNKKSNTVYLKREVKGRGGKTVTTISNIGPDVKTVQKELQRLCGAGGTTKNGIIEIQGDHREKIKEHLEKKGCQVKLSGG